MKNSQDSLTNKLLIISYILPLILQLTFLIYQLAHKIFSSWGIIATVIMFALFIFTIKSEKDRKKELEKLNLPKEGTGGSTVDHFAVTPSKKPLIIKIIITVCCLILSVTFFIVYSNKSKNLEVVNSRVISQSGKTTITNEESDHGISQSEEEYVDVVVEYTYNGEVKTAKLDSSTTHKIYVDELKIYVDQNGNFVTDYGRIEVWKYEAIIFLSSSIAILLILIFSLGSELVAGVIFTLVGTSMFFLIGCQFIENILFNDILCFISMFVNIGIFMLTMGTLSIITSSIQKKKLASNKNEKLSNQSEN